MDKRNVIKFLSVGVKLLSVGGGLAAYTHIIPASYLPIAALAFASASLLKDTLIGIGDIVDDGVKNDSFKG
jgi:hypothetical protein